MEQRRSGSVSESTTTRNNTGNNDIISAAAILKQKYPGQLDEIKNEQSRVSSRKFFAVTSVLATIVIAGWLRWSEISFIVDYDFIYNSGLVGGILMLIALTYSLRKRVAVLKNAGKIESWYYMHLCAGISGPLIIIFHSSFAIKSINSLIAIIAMLLIVCSGALGRFLFTRLSFIMHSKLDRINREEEQLFKALVKYDSEIMHKHLSRLTVNCLTQPKTIWHIPYAYLLVRGQAAVCYILIGNQITKVLVEVAKRARWDTRTLQITILNEKRYLRQYINTLMDVSRVRSFEQLLGKWRVFHVPLIYLLVLCVLAHVWAVHAYS